MAFSFQSSDFEPPLYSKEIWVGLGRTKRDMSVIEEGEGYNMIQIEWRHLWTPSMSWKNT